jgi:DNA-binding transcriptional MerR regulator
MTSIRLKTGQVAAVLGITPKQIQNDVDAGYVWPTVAGQGRGSIRLYSLEDVVRIKVLEILVQAYGLERQRATALLARAWPQRLAPSARVLVIPLAVTASGEGIDLEPIRLPLGTIVKTTKQRIHSVLEEYREKKRGRPVGWSQQMRQSLAEVSTSLQGASDEQIQQEITAYRATRRPRSKEAASR